MEINEVLKDLGFEDREIKIYLVLLKKGDLTALKISKEVRIDRTTIYDILERLIDKGIVSGMIKNKAKHYSALGPKKLLALFKEKYSSLEKILPELSKLGVEDVTGVNCELFQGIDGLKVVIRDLISAKKDYKVIGIKKQYEEIIGFLNDHGVINLNDFNVKERGIYTKGEKFKKLKKGSYKQISKGLSSDVTTLIYDNVVVFFIWKEPYFAIRIEDPEFRKAQEEYFDLLWKLGI